MHPYEKLNYFEQTKAIVNGDPPKLNNSCNKFSQEFCEFIDLWYLFLIK
jgi:hypothetical protein